ncbi:MAG: molybdenum cofactor biosynthesis protein [Candidatus Thermoplasmatota archaeon]|nr:molybdenum cofactor biosynthesis protein [Euryarchaeota archaeon]MBU4032448.1 molybdenum cofactor biosynthesis protein [Candidatus Thermoplasmatota archaeon]MBU4071561.1 molybdenum cofactor biosynthesis protein [Candidatus Thermoplasmatota archaeon]MBU4144472.1 molybdenum cofactor biosynthesis protein [Candidatus Thermoplasmatota archaeon]MBU4592296.1 molybdenum cofactor biosynthesis protein [Candidatus Thermoplasmatota archaeon]
MKPFRDLITFEEALKIILENSQPVSRTETVELEDSAGRVLVNDVTASRNVPGFSRAAMDGYAVRARDTFGASRTAPKTLNNMGQIFTGEAPNVTVENGQCIQIATGAPMPEGADSVVMVEETAHENDSIMIFKPVYPGANMSSHDSDISKGTVVLKAGIILDPPRIGVLAALGFEKVDVYGKPKVGIYPTGSEIAKPGDELKFGMVYDINSYTLASLLEKAGAEVIIHPIVKDTEDALVKCIQGASQDDYAVFSGGSSVGERDLLSSVVEKLGTILFHGIALKPGKPTLLGKVGETMILGLPGYPTSCLTNAYALFLPAVKKMARLPNEINQVNAQLAERVVSTIGRHHLYTVRLENGLAYPAFKESGAITSMSNASGWIDIPQNTEFLEKGTRVVVNMF